jgi:hypothetical protein
MQEMPPNWDNIKPAGSNDMLDKISSTKDNIDEVPPLTSTISPIVTMEIVCILSIVVFIPVPIP